MVEDLPGRYRRARSFFWTLSALGAWVHVQFFWLYQYDAETAQPSPGLFALQLPWLLTEHLWLAALLGALIWLLGRDPRIIVFSAGAFLLVGLYLLADQVYFSLFQNHISLSASEGKIAGLEALWGSFIAEVHAPTYLNIFLLIIGLTWVVKRSAATSDSPTHWSEHPRLMAVLGLWYVLGYVSSTQSDQQLMKLNYLSVLWSSSDTGIVSVESRVDQQTLYTPIYGSHSTTEQQQAVLDGNFSALQTTLKEDPNVLLVVLESVGSLQLLPGGEFDPDITPFLASKKSGMQIFDNIYAPFPSTARAHIPLLTGGSGITWGSVYDEFKYRYMGSTLVSHFKNNGYNTGFFSAGDLSYENRMAFYRNLPFDQITGSNTLDQKQRKAHSLNSWGVEESYAWSLGLEWLDRQHGPSFLHYMTVSSHHPYSYPDTLVTPLPSTDNWSRYRNSLFYADSLIKQMVSDLEQRGLADDTLLVITGDHGQAFGKRHRGNYTHKNRLYEENLRTFMLILPLGEDTELTGNQSSRPAAIGDIAATLFALDNEDVGYYPSQNLFSETYQPQLNFFHKSADPSQWGVRDGQWKFLGKITTKQNELYNLDEDPGEKNNLAEQYPDRVAQYEARTAQWFLDTNNRFRARLADYHGLGDRDLNAGDFRTHGPKALDFGVRVDGEFIPKTLFKPNDRITVWTRWVPFDEEREADYYWVAPDGEQVHANRFKLKKGWSSTWVHMPAERPLQSGTWTLRLKLEGQLALTGQFEVMSGAE